VNAAPEAVPLGLRTEMTFVGAEVTTRALFAPSEPDAPGAGRVNVAAFVAASSTVPPFNANDEVDT
jgi:hypothetical protein